jgi:hypothetical protein
MDTAETEVAEQAKDLAEAPRTAQQHEIVYPTFDAEIKETTRPEHADHFL